MSIRPDSGILRTIAKARKSGVKVTEAVVKEDLELVARLVNDSRKRLALPLMPPEFLVRISALRSDRLGKSYLARCQGVVVGSIICLDFRRMRILEYVGDLRLDSSPGVVPSLIMTALEDGASCGYDVLSLGRTALANPELIKYKSRWGAESKDLQTWFSGPRARSPHKATTSSSLAHRVVRQVLRTAPDPLARAIGGFCYRHLG